MKRVALPFAFFYLMLAAFALAGDNSPILGSWDCVSASPSGEGEMKWVLKVSEQNGKIAGTAGTDEGGVDLIDPKFENGKLTFKVSIESGAYSIELKVKDESLEGAWTSESGQKGAIKGAKRA